MEKIYLSDAGPKVSPAIYGFYRWNEVENPTQTIERIVNLCLELGINTFDHADIYGAYQCEELFGRVISQKSFKREDIVLFTKCGLRVPHPDHPEIRTTHINTSKEHIIASLDNSLKKLKTDYIDIFLLNHLDPVSNLEETAYTLNQLKESGKVRNIGIANFSVFQHQLLAAYLKLPIVTNHIELNLLNTTALDNGQIDYIKQGYMRPLASAPLAAGRIANDTGYLPAKVRAKLDEMKSNLPPGVHVIAISNPLP